VPNPFVLAPLWEGGRLVPEGGEAGLRPTLIGRAVEHAGFARHAEVEAGLRALGPDRGALDPSSVEGGTPPPIGPCPGRVDITLLSPLRLVDAGRLVGLTGLRPRHLLRRVSTPAERHEPAPLDLDYRALKEDPEAAEFAEAALRWVEWARWSGRRPALVQMGGLLGSLSLPLAGADPFWSFLALAPWVHVGKGATMGLGAMRATAA
jgi:CRISPR-associated endoribonuclease Cas6